MLENYGDLLLLHLDNCTPLLHCNLNTRDANCHLRGGGEMNGAQTKTKIRTMMQELLQLTNRYVSEQTDVKQ